jgi:hypothetical protein
LPQLPENGRSKNSGALVSPRTDPIATLSQPTCHNSPKWPLEEFGCSRVATHRSDSHTVTAHLPQLPEMAARRIRVLSCRHAPIRKPHCPLATIPRNWPVEEFGCSRVPTHRSETQSNEQYPHTMSPTTLTPSHDAHSI